MSPKQKIEAIKALAIAHKELQIAQANIGAQFTLTKSSVSNTMLDVYTLMQNVESLPTEQDQCS